jgi:hypothetical protein
MKYTFAVLLSFLFFHTYAAFTGTTLIHFTVDDQAYYLISNCNPGSNVELFSQKWGGKGLMTLLADSTGSARVKTDTSFKPAFALNRNRRNENGKIGNGTVGFTPEAEFSLDNMTMSLSGDNVQINWQGKACNDTLINYTVVKTKNGTTDVLCTYTGNKDGQYYSYVGEYDADAVYSIQIFNITAGLRYQTPINVAGRTNEIQVFPTVVSNNVNIIVPAKNAVNEYRIIDMQGRVVMSGALYTGKNNLSLKNLAPGNYLVSVPDNIPVKIVRD